MAEYRSPEQAAGQVLHLLRRYNVMYKEQLYGFFPGEERAVGRGLKWLLKNRQIYINEYTRMLASSEYAYSLKDEGTIKSLWVLIDLLKKKPVEGHYLAAREDYPIRIILFSQAELYDILFVGTGDVKVINGMYLNRKREEGKHIVVVEETALIEQISIPGMAGFCFVKEDGEVEYYKKAEGR